MSFIHSFKNTFWCRLWAEHWLNQADMAFALTELSPLCGEPGIILINTTKNGLQIAAGDMKEEADWDWGRSMEGLSEEMASKLRLERKDRW